MKPPVTIRQVAEAAGVSPATASRVMSGTRNVTPELRRRVLAAGKRLDYRANRVARALRTRSTGTVGMVVPNITNPFFPVIIQAVEKELRAHGTQLLLCDSGDNVAQETELVRSLLDHRIDGILLSPCDRVSSQNAVRWALGRVPLVQIDRRALLDAAFVGVDQEAAMTEVVEHLSAQGCQRFAYVTSSSRASTAAERYRGYRRAVRHFGNGSDRRLYPGDFSIEWGAEAARRILAEGDIPDAIVCANDVLALGVLVVFRSKGLDVPGDVLLTGFDDTQLAAVAWPPLTSVRQPLEDVGKKAVELLQARNTSDSDGRGAVCLFRAELVVRRSSRHERPTGAMLPDRTNGDHQSRLDAESVPL
ncbi:MAG: LacI family DNA-binding transcriptional regulator [Acidimicrobiales bacterium]